MQTLVKLSYQPLHRNNGAYADKHSNGRLGLMSLMVGLIILGSNLWVIVRVIVSYWFILYHRIGFGKRVSTYSIL